MDKFLMVFLRLGIFVPLRTLCKIKVLRDEALEYVLSEVADHSHSSSNNTAAGSLAQGFEQGRCHSS